MTEAPDTVLTAVLALSDTDLARRVGFDTLNRGLMYATGGRVLDVQVTNELVMAQVGGSGQASYTVLVGRRAGGEVWFSCTCPLRGDCKHCVAVVLRLRTLHASGSASATATTAHREPAWRRALAPLVRSAGGTGTPLALQFEWHGDALAVEPRAWGRSGRWVKSGAEWQGLAFAMDGFDEAHRRALRGLRDCLDPSARPMRGGYYGYADQDRWMRLDRLSPQAWRWLQTAADVGVEFLPPQGMAAVELEQPASVAVEAATGDDGSVTLAVRARLAGGSATPLLREELLGDPPHGLSWVDDADVLHLAPLDPPLDRQLAALAAAGDLVVPASDLPEFMADFLPALRDRVPLRTDALALPEAAPPVVAADIAVLPEGGGAIEWSFRYEIGERTSVVPALRASHDAGFRDVAAEDALAASLGEGPWQGGLGTPLASCVLRGRDWMRFVEDVLPVWQARDDVVVHLSAVPEPFREAQSAPEVRLGVRPPDAAHWFGLDVDVRIDGEQVPFAELFTALSLGHSELVLDSGLWFDLERPELQRLRELIAEASRLTDRPPGELQLRPEHAAIWDELVQLGIIDQQAQAWHEAVDALLHVERLPEVEPGPGVHATLRPYQLTGFRWLAFLWRSRLGGILADEMGLGKTLQALSLLAWAKDAGELDHPALVVAPTSVIATWVREAATFTPGLRVVARTATTRKGKVPLAEQLAEADLVVTSYTLLRLDEAEFAAQRWSAVLLDEAQFVKNRQSQGYKAVRRLPARLKVALTGTPLENNLMDLWSMLSLGAPGLFSDPHAFTELYRRPIEAGDAEALARLQHRIRPLVLRRTKDAVATELPPKQEAVLEVQLDATHRRVYDRQLQRERQRVLKLVDDLDRNRVSVLSSLTTLRLLALSPHLVDDEAPATSAKVDLLVERLQVLAAEGHRALVFSQFTSFLRLVADRLADAGIAASYLDGSTRHRADVIEGFRTGDDPVFLISLKAGGFGLTLVEADYVFILDPWWNPAAENQAIDRTHRIGQTAHVMVYRIVAAHTIEQKVLELQQAKRDLFDQVVGGADADLAAPLTADDIRALLSD